jgi:DNA-binding transcriptional regulator YiaG
MSDTLQETNSEVSELLERVRARRRLPPAAERRRIRQAAGISQDDMARALGVSQMSIWRWERGTRPREHEAAYARLLDELERLTS